MAALLYLGETTHARHLWRRSLKHEEPYLHDWWMVGQCMILQKNEQDALQRCASHPEPLLTFAHQVAERILTKKQQTKSASPITNNNSNMAHVVSFMETTPWNAP
mmetsp:Transcript_11853/g.27451  ORF Transcript_11853/g.27451 Transcript_11853/m.27451 type:complete len:105 (+) Transcript_11853:122-436(+)